MPRRRASEIWAANIATKPTVRVKDGRFSAKLTGTARNLGGVEGRTGEFRWKFSGRFTAARRRHRDRQRRGRVRVRGKTCLDVQDRVAGLGPARDPQRAERGIVFRRAPIGAMNAATILLVEDDPVVRTFLADNLTADGYELLVTDSVEDARAACSSSRARTSPSSTSGCPTAPAWT